jgi:hypothetical protein
MEIELLYKSLDKLFDQLLKKRIDLDYTLSIDEGATKIIEEPIFKLNLIVDPEKYHWSGTDYDPRYHDQILRVEDYITNIVKYLGLSLDNFSSTDTIFDPAKVKEYYSRIIPMIPPIWKLFQKSQRYLQVPDLKFVQMKKRLDNDYDLIFHLDRSTFPKVTNNFSEIYYPFFNSFGLNELPMDSHYIDFTF